MLTEISDVEDIEATGRWDRTGALTEPEDETSDEDEGIVVERERPEADRDWELRDSF